MTRIKTVVFDLDNTLYDAEQFFKISFEKIAQYLSDVSGLSSRSLYDEMYKIWATKTSMYPYLFTDLLNDYDLQEKLPDVLQLFQDFDGELEPYSGVAETLDYLKNAHLKLGIVTDGNAIRQAKKLNALHLSPFFDCVIYTDLLKRPKPSPVSFQYILKELATSPSSTVYLGDNPLIDFKGSKAIGMKTIRLMKGEFGYLPSDEDVDIEILEFSELIEVIL
jgi:putative hydrolase of the HAD superfamily